MACARDFLEQLEAVDLSSSAPPPALETIKAAVLSRFPELTDMYDAWWKTEKVSLESAYTEATKADSLEQVKTHLKAAAPFMLATHDRNLDKDCSTISELQYAPKTTDFVESSFAAVDWTTRTLCGASMEACLGVAHAMVLKAFVSDGAKQQASASAARKKRQKTGGTSDSDQAAFAEQLEAWDTTSFFKLPPEERWVVIRDLQYRYKTKCVTEPRERLAKHDAAVVDRLKHKAEEHVRLVMNRVIAYQKHNEIVACVSAAALEALRGKHESDKALAEALRDQIRVRQHVYGMKQKDLPAIGSGSGELAVTRLMSELAVVVSEPLPRKPPPPLPYPVRAAHPAPTQTAVALDIEHIHKIAESITELLRLTKEGVFVALRSSAPRTRAGRAAGVPAAGQSRTPSAAQQQLVGEEFEEEGVSWKVLHVGWSEKLEEMVVWYYDVDMAAEAELTDDELDALRKAGELTGPLELSSVAEVRTWIAEWKAGA